jgi:hypothetical protein
LKKSITKSGHAEVAIILVKHGATINLPDRQGLLLLLLLLLLLYQLHYLLIAFVKKKS